MRGRPVSRPRTSTSRHLWADAEACRSVVREALFLAADQRRLMLTLLTHKSLNLPQSSFIRGIVLGEGGDGVSQRIRQLAMDDDIIISSDASLCTEMRKRGMAALDPQNQQEFVRKLEDLLAPPAPVAAKAAAPKATGKTPEAWPLGTAAPGPNRVSVALD